mgnify:FL=1
MLSVNSVAPRIHFEKLAALILGGVFLYAGAVKMSDPLAFADSIASFKILPIILINPLALSLPPLEIFIGAMLAIAVSRKLSAVSSTREMANGGQQNGNGSLLTAHRSLALRRLGALSVIILSSIFCLALLSALLRGIQVDCGCFGSGKPSILKTWLAFGRDILFFAIATAIYLRSNLALLPRRMITSPFL